MSWHYRFGLRFILAAVVLAALILGWVVPQQRRADERTALVAELAGVGVRPILEEPTAWGLLLGGDRPGYRRWLRDRLGRGWFDRPTVVVCQRLVDNQVPFAVERLRRLGTVREVHTVGSRLTQRGVFGLESALPGVDVALSASWAPHRYYRNQVKHEHSGVEGLKLAALLALGLLGTLVFFAWPLVRRGRPKPIDVTEESTEAECHD